MAQFKVNNHFLELSKGIDLAFSFFNSIFGFERIELSRTQQFKVPATPENNRIFALANRPDFSGQQVRVIHDAEMWYSGGVIHGRMYVVSCDRHEYNCVFIFGEQMKLKELKESGELGAFLNVPEVMVWNNTVHPRQSYALPPNLGLVPYLIQDLHRFREGNWGQGWNFMPSTSFLYLLNQCASRFGVTLNLTGVLPVVERLVIKLNGMNRGGVIAPGSTIRVDGVNYVDFPVGLFTQSALPALYNNAICLVAAAPVRLHIVATIPQVEEGGTPDIDYWRRAYFILIFNTDNQVINTFRAGAVDALIDLEAGHKIATLELHQSEDHWISQGTYSAFNIPMICRYLHISSDKITYGVDSYFLQPNLPKVTFVDLLHAVARITRTAILYDEATDTISFFNFANFQAPIGLDDKILQMGRVERIFRDFGQKSYVRFKNSPKVLPGQQVEDIYVLNNQILEPEKTIHEIKLSGGGNGGRSPATEAHNFLILSDIVREVAANGTVTHKFGGDADTLCTVAPGTEYLQQVKFQPNPALQQIIDKSTQIQVQVRMFLFEFLQIRHDTAYILQGIRYAVVSGNFKNNTANLVLQQL